MQAREHEVVELLGVASCLHAAVEYGILELPIRYVQVREHEVLDPPARYMQTGEHEVVELLGTASWLCRQVHMKSWSRRLDSLMN